MYLHGHDASESVEGGVGDVQAAAVAAGDDHHHHIDRDDVDDEHVPAPCRHHVEVGEGLLLVRLVEWKTTGQIK